MKSCERGMEMLDGFRAGDIVYYANIAMSEVGKMKIISHRDELREEPLRARHLGHEQTQWPKEELLFATEAEATNKIKEEMESQLVLMKTDSETNIKQLKEKIKAIDERVL